MKISAVSIAARYMALFRSIETGRPRHKRLFCDPFAAAFLSPRQQWIRKAAAVPLLGDVVVHLVNHRRSGALAAGIARTRYIDELLQKAVDGGARQLIILGTGFDTRALRLQCLGGLPVYEFDLPATLRYKQSVLQSVAGRLPEHVRYIETNFNEDDLEALLAQQPIDTGLPTAVLWEGVTNHLAPAAVNMVFRALKKLPRGSRLIFTYIDKRVLETPRLFDAATRLAERRCEKDEPLAFGFHTAELPHYLDLFGFSLQEDIGACEYRRLYMSGRKGWRRGYGFYRVAVAVKR